MFLHSRIAACLIPSFTISFFAATSQAVELAPGFTLGGWGEAIGRGEVTQPNSPLHPTDRSLGRTDRELDASAAAAVKLRYEVERFTLRADLIAYDEPPFASSTSNLLLERASVEYAQSDVVTWRAGRIQTTWLGWEGFHTADLWRVNHSAAWDWNVQNHALKPNKPFVSDGVGLLLHTADGIWNAEFYAVDDVLGDGDDTRGTDKAVGASFSTRQPGLGHAELGLAYDPRSVNTGVGNRDSHAFAVDFNTDITAWIESGWFFATEVQWHHHPDLTIGSVVYGNDLVLLAMANYAFTDTVSGTLMVDYVDRGLRAVDNEVTEYAVALLTRPHPQVRFNSELFYWNETAADADAWGAAAVVNVALP